MIFGGRFIFSQSDAVLRQPRPPDHSAAEARGAGKRLARGMQSVKNFSKFLGIKPAVQAQGAKLILQCTRKPGHFLLNGMFQASHVRIFQSRDCKSSIYFNIDGRRRNLSKKTCHNAPI